MTRQPVAQRFLLFLLLELVNGKISDVVSKAIGEKRNDPKLNTMELAAYAMTASLILNLDEAITKQ